MSLLDKGNFLIIGLLLLITSSCEQDESIIKVNVEGVTNTSYIEFNLPTSEIFIDSLRTDDSDFILVGDYEDPLLGTLAAEAYFELQYDSGAVIADTLLLDSVVFMLKIEDQLMKDASAIFNMDIYTLSDSLFSEAIYLATKELSLDKKVQSVTEYIYETDSLLTFSGVEFGRYFYGEIQRLEAIDLYSYRNDFSFVPASENEALLSFSTK